MHACSADPTPSLHAHLAALPGAVVAFSGGVDSTALLHACAAAFGDRVLAVTADSPSLARAELADARALAGRLGVRHVVLQTAELARPGYARNGADRCFHCKDELFTVIRAHLRRATGDPAAGWPILYGAIADDLGDYRPGARAARAHGVLAPLADGGWSKAVVRAYSAAHGLPTAAKPQLACLASRVPHGTPIDAALLGRIERAEAVLRGLGYRQFRVRHHGEVARLELDMEDIPRALGADRERLDAGIRAAGYRFVAVDLAGYRSGSLNPPVVG